MTPPAKPTTKSPACSPSAYPGGPVVDQLAQHGDPKAIRFGTPKMTGNANDFSFSGIKTAVLYHLQKHAELQPEIAARKETLARGERSAAALLPLCTKPTLDLIASFQHAVVEDLVARTLRAADETHAKSILVTGGVAANRELRLRFEAEAAKAGKLAYFPRPRALHGQRRHDRRRPATRSSPPAATTDSTLNADPNLQLALPPSKNAAGRRAKLKPHRNSATKSPARKYKPRHSSSPHRPRAPSSLQRNSAISFRLALVVAGAGPQVRPQTAAPSPIPAAATM